MNLDIVFCLVWMITPSVKGSDITLTTSPGVYVFLTKYGYTYIPGLSAWFTFKVKTCGFDVVIFLNSDTNNSDVDAIWNYRVLLGGWGNTQSELSSRDKQYKTSYHQDSIISCTEWRSFWVSWKNGDLTVGKGQVLYDDQIMKLEQPPFLFDIRFLVVYTLTTGQWKIPSPGFIRSSCTQWRLLPGSIHFNITRNISWIVSATNMKDCALACVRGVQCVSFVYNDDKSQCQGHSRTFNNVYEGGGMKTVGSCYYVQP